MADEITLAINFRALKGSLDIRKLPKATITMAGTHYAAGVQSIGTSEELIAISADVANYGVALLVNTDATNFIEIGVKPAATFYPLLRIKPGECQLVRLSPAIPPYAKADTATAKLEYIVLEA